LYCGPVPCRWYTRCHSFPYRSAGKGAPYWGSNHREGSAIAELEAPLSLSCRPKYPWRASVAPFPPRYASAALSTVCPPGTTIKVIKVWTRLYNRSVRPIFFSGPAFLPFPFGPTTSSGPPSFPHLPHPHGVPVGRARTSFFVVCGVCGATLIIRVPCEFRGPPCGVRGTNARRTLLLPYRLLRPIPAVRRVDGFRASLHPVLPTGSVGRPLRIRGGDGC